MTNKLNVCFKQYSRPLSQPYPERQRRHQDDKHAGIHFLHQSKFTMHGFVHISICLIKKLKSRPRKKIPKETNLGYKVFFGDTPANTFRTSHFCVLDVVKHLVKRVIWWSIKEYTRAKNRLSVLNVARHLLTIIVGCNIIEHIQEKNHMSH